MRDRIRSAQHVNYSHLLLIQLVFQTTIPADQQLPHAYHQNLSSGPMEATVSDRPVHKLLLSGPNQQWIYLASWNFLQAMLSNASEGIVSDLLYGTLTQPFRTSFS